MWLVTFISEMFKYDCLLVLLDPTGEPCGWSPSSPRCSSMTAFSCYRIPPESHVYGHLHLRDVQVCLPSRVIGSHRRAMWLVTFISEMFKYSCLLVLSDPTGEPCVWSPSSPRCSSIPAFSCYRIPPESHVAGHLHLRDVQVFLPSRVIGSNRRVMCMVLA